MITNITKDLNVCGIYKINYDDGKIYIGQAMNIYVRALEHNSKKIQYCDKKLKKHNATIEILEIVNNFKILDEVETKWIKKFNATENGYNILKEGNASGKRGIENCNASLNQQQLKEIIDLLQNHLELSYKDIANKYNISQNTVLKISKGYTYKDLNLQYPLRDNDHTSKQKNTLIDYNLTEDTVLSIKEDLLYRWDLSVEKDLFYKYNIPLRLIRDINQGEKFKNIGNFKYPIRKKNIRNNINLNQDDIFNILNELKTTKHSMSVIGEKYGINRGTISKINQGEAYIIKNFKYPAR